MSSSATDLEMTSPDVEAMSPEQAGAKLAELLKNPDWRDRYLKGAGPAVKEHNSLAQKKSEGGDRLDRIVAGTEEPAWFETISPANPVSTSNLIKTASWFRDIGFNDQQIRQVLSGERVSRAEYEAIKLWRADRIGDREWTERLLAGDHQATRELLLASTVIANGYREEREEKPV